MFFKIAVWLGNILNISGAPICRVWNDTGTEHYTLKKDGWIIIGSPDNGSYDMVFISHASERLINKFEIALNKLNKVGGDL
tara:strand:+ start:1176 stop:1418 length:243 start_codon:yes stop_codon:yes gene_type:complete